MIVPLDRHFPETYKIFPASCRDSFIHPSWIQPPPREVPAFTIQAQQKNTKVKCSASQKLAAAPQYPKTEFRQLYEARVLPIALDRDSGKVKMKWLKSVKELNYEMLLPVFFEGLCESRFPYNVLALQGCTDLLNFAKGRARRVLPRLVWYIRQAFKTEDIFIITEVCDVLKVLAMYVGKDLVQHYQSILRPLHKFSESKFQVFDKHGIDKKGKRFVSASAVIMNMLCTLQMTGGPDAYRKIQYCIPLYNSLR